MLYLSWYQIFRFVIVIEAQPLSVTDVFAEEKGPAPLQGIDFLLRGLAYYDRENSFYLKRKQNIAAYKMRF